MSGAAVVVRGLRVTRGRTEVVRGLDFTLEVGRVTGLLGPSGCGKSTLMRTLVGVQAGVTGEVTVLGAPAGSAILRSRIGYQTQAPSVYDDLSVRENLAFFGRVLGVPRERIDEVLAVTGLTAKADAVVADLSGGQRGRVSLGAALLGRPDLLVLDEPTVGLDPVLREELWGTFHDLAAAGTAVLVSSHVMDEAERCDRLLLMRDGVLIADGTPTAIKEQAGAPDIEQAFLAIVRGGGAG